MTDRGDDPATGHVCPDPLTQIVTVDQLAARLGVGASAIREHLRAGTAADWLPRPAGRIGRSHVWRTSDLVDIELNRRPPGPHVPRPTPEGPSEEPLARADNPTERWDETTP